MAVIRIHAQKDARCMQAVCQINGDRRTQILRFDVNRFDGGVDLGGLRWVIKTTNALGVEDIFDPEVVEIKERTITVDWLVNGSVTDGDGMATYELNGIDTADDGQPVQWSGGLGSISVRAGQGPKFGESDGMTNIEKLILYVEGELEGVVEAGSAALDAAERANHAADVLGDPAEAVDRANAAAQRAETAADTVGDLEAAVNRANTAATEALNAKNGADKAADDAYSAAIRAGEAAANVENIEEATLAAHEAAEAANLAAATAAEAALPHVQLYGRRVMGEVAKVSGNPVTCLADAGSLLQPVTVLEPQQEGSGDPSPSNIRPISGYDKLDLHAAGKNLLPNLAVAHSESGVVFTVNPDGSITINGTATAQVIYGINLTSVYLPAGEYIATNILNGVNEKYYVTFYTKDDASTRVDIYGKDKSFVLADGECVRNFRIVVRAGAVFENLTFYPMIRRATIADATYAPYQGKLHTVQIGQTVYGGKFDWLAGEIIATKSLRVFTGTESYTTVSSGGVTTPLTDAAAPVAGGVEAWCSHYKRTSAMSISGIADGEFTVSHKSVSGVPRLFIRDSVNGTNATALRDYFLAQYAAGTPVEISYELAEPIRIPIAPAIISAVEPEQINTLYGDGSIEVEYVKPLHVSIEERVAAALAAAMQTE